MGDKCAVPRHIIDVMLCEQNFKHMFLLWRSEFDFSFFGWNFFSKTTAKWDIWVYLIFLSWSCKPGMAKIIRGLFWGGPFPTTCSTGDDSKGRGWRGFGATFWRIQNLQPLEDWCHGCVYFPSEMIEVSWRISIFFRWFLKKSLELLWKTYIYTYIYIYISDGLTGFKHLKCHRIGSFPVNQCRWLHGVTYTQIWVYGLALLMGFAVGWMFGKVADLGVTAGIPAYASIYQHWWINTLCDKARTWRTCGSCQFQRTWRLKI